MNPSANEAAGDRPSRPQTFAQFKVYGLAVLSVGISLSVALLLQHFRFRDTAVPLLLFACAASAWYGGTRSAVLAATLSTASFYWFFVEPVRTIHIYLSEIPYFLTFAGFVSLISWFSAVRRRVERELRDRSAALEESKAHLAEAQRLSQTGSWSLDVVHNQLSWSDEVFRIFGIQAGMPMTYETFLEAVYPDDCAFVDQAWRKALLGEPYDIEHRILVGGAGGALRWVREMAQLEFDAHGRPVKGVGTVQDITERKQAEEALRRLNRELKAISNCNQILLRATNEQSLINEVCRTICEDAGYRMAWVAYAEQDETRSVHPVAGAGSEDGLFSALGTTWADAERGRGPTGTAIRTGISCCVQDFATDPRIEPWRDIILERGFCSGIGLPLKDENDNTFGSLSIYSAKRNAFTSEEIHLLEELAGDLAFGIVTLHSRAARRQAEEALRQNQAYLAEAQRLSQTGSWAFNVASNKYDYVSDECFRVFGVARRDDFPTREEVSRLIHQEDWDSVDESFKKSLQEKVDTSSEFRITLPNGTLRRIQAIRHPFLNDAGDVVRLVGSVIDVTERKRAEEERERLRQLEAELAHIDRMSMLGELSASIAHEVNQPLAGVVSGGSACLRWLAADPPNLEEAREAARRIVAAGKRAAEVIARIRSLTTKAVSPREQLHLNETIQEVLALVGDEVKRKNVIIRTQFADDVSPVSGDRVQLQQVVLNLVLNGIEAMSRVADRTRELVITTRNIDGDQVQVTFRDSGIGIDTNTINRIFDSFYTTKPGGMGMGLSISRSIVQAHEGRIWASKNDGPGTTLHFTLPKYQAKESSAGF